MKRHEIISTVIKFPLDFSLIFISFFLAKELRLIKIFIPDYFNLQIQTIDNISLSYYALAWSLLYVFLLASHWLYSSKINFSKAKEIIDIIRYWIYTFLFLSVFIYFSKWFINIKEIPRLILLYSFVIWTILVIIWRILINKIYEKLLNIWIIPKQKLLIINNRNDNEIQDIILDIKKAKIYDIYWYINKNNIWSSIKYLWDTNIVEKLFENKFIDEIIFIESDFNKNELFKIWNLSKTFWIRYRYITNNFDITRTNTQLSLINSIPVIEIKNSPLESVWWRFFKRLFDIIWSLVWIIIFFPIMIIVWILIKIEDPKWPIIYKNKRIWNNKEFNLYKFRYMKWEYCIKDSYGIKNEDDLALEYEKKLIEERSIRKWPLYKIENDPRKTKIWNFIEKYSIDELPQFFNAFIWNMSLIWPRPHQLREVEKYMTQHKRLLTVKPWISWMAQVNWRENNSFEDEFKYDIFYIENWSIILDIKLIFKTISSILKR